MEGSSFSPLAMVRARLLATGGQTLGHFVGVERQMAKERFEGQCWWMSRWSCVFSCKWSHLEAFFAWREMPPRGFLQKRSPTTLDIVWFQHRIMMIGPLLGGGTDEIVLFEHGLPVSLPAWPVRCSVLVRMRSRQQAGSEGVLSV